MELIGKTIRFSQDGGINYNWGEIASVTLGKGVNIKYNAVAIVDNQSDVPVNYKWYLGSGNGDIPKGDLFSKYPAGVGYGQQAKSLLDGEEVYVATGDVYYRWNRECRRR